MKKFLGSLMAVALTAGILSGCGNTSVQGGSKAQTFDDKKQINVVSRENGSGTRGAFIELFKVEVKGQDSKKKDMTTKEAVIANKTDVMLTNIAGDAYGIGYVSLGSLNASVKSLSIDGVQATAENIKNQSYKIARPFNIAGKGELTAPAKDFISFILSKQGQEIVSKNYIAVINNAPSYAGSSIKGKIVVAGSSSVTPVMEKLAEAYMAINKDAKVEIQMSDSSAGMKGALDGTCDIGMASRDLKESELKDLKAVVIALDGIAVIVNKDNPLNSLKSEQVRQIFTGQTNKWADLK